MNKDATSYTFRHWTIRPDMLEALRDYVTYGRPLGWFLTKVLENNLVEALGAADDENLVTIPAFGAWLYNEAPSRCWGSAEKVAAWLAMHSAKRTEATQNGEQR